MPVDDGNAMSCLEKIKILYIPGDRDPTIDSQQRGSPCNPWRGARRGAMAYIGRPRVGTDKQFGRKLIRSSSLAVRHAPDRILHLKDQRSAIEGCAQEPHLESFPRMFGSSAGELAFYQNLEALYPSIVNESHVGTMVHAVASVMTSPYQ